MFDTPERSPIAPITPQIVSKLEPMPSYEGRLPTEQQTTVQQPLSLDLEMACTFELADVDFELLLAS